MGKKDTKDLTKFLHPFSDEVNKLAFWLRDFVWDLYPKCNELIYDNYNAVAFGWSPTDKLGDTFCSVAVWRPSKKVIFGFYWGAKIADPEKLLIGNGNQFRYIRVPDKKSFPKEYVKKLIAGAYAYSISKMKPGPESPQGTTITKSISPVKRAESKKKPVNKISSKKKAETKKTVRAGKKPVKAKKLKK